MDRFLMKLSMEALSPAEETQMIARFLTEEPLAELSSVCQKKKSVPCRRRVKKSTCIRNWYSISSTSYRRRESTANLQAV